MTIHRFAEAKYGTRATIHETSARTESRVWVLRQQPPSTLVSAETGAALYDDTHFWTTTWHAKSILRLVLSSRSMRAFVGAFGPYLRDAV